MADDFSDHIDRMVNEALGRRKNFDPGSFDPNELYPVPEEHEFDGAKWISAPDLAKFGKATLLADDATKWLDKHTIHYLWRAKGGSKQGRYVYGGTSIPGGMFAFFCPAEIVIWLAADTVRAQRFTVRQVQAALFHEYLHLDKSSNETLTLRGHDAEMFTRELKVYGLWQPGSEPFTDAVRQLDLW